MIQSCEFTHDTAGGRSSTVLTNLTAQDSRPAPASSVEPVRSANSPERTLRSANSPEHTLRSCNLSRTYCCAVLNSPRTTFGRTLARSIGFNLFQGRTQAGGTRSQAGHGTNAVPGYLFAGAEAARGVRQHQAYTTVLTQATRNFTQKQSGTRVHEADRQQFRGTSLPPASLDFNLTQISALHLLTETGLRLLPAALASQTPHPKCDTKQCTMRLQGKVSSKSHGSGWLHLVKTWNRAPLLQRRWRSLARG